MSSVLNRVYWIGGPPDAGKSSTALALRDLLAEAVSVYRQDAHERDHIARADANRFPLHAAMRQRLASDPGGFVEQWASEAPDVLAANARATWIERIPLVLEDLTALPGDGIILAEGPGFFPSAIRLLLPDTRHAAWLLPTEGFKRASHTRRDKTAFRDQTSDPDRAVANHIARDLLLAEIYRAELAPGDLWLEVDGSRSVEEVARAVARRFGLSPTR